MTGFLEAAAAIAPVALLLDDLHWADSASIDLLLHLARHLRGASLLLLGTYRDVEVDPQHPLQPALRDLTREQLLEQVALRRLPGHDTEALIRERLGEVERQEAFAGLVHRYTDGNPFFTVQLLHTLIEDGALARSQGSWAWRVRGEITLPESVRSVIGQRLSRLSDSTQAILREASVLGQTFDFDDLQGMAGRLEEEVDAALQEAHLRGVIQPGSRDRYRFDHALTQQTLAEALSPLMRRRLHRAAGEALERLRDVQRRQRAAELAWHFLEGMDDERALRYALLAGEQARGIFAQSEAERQYRTALRLAREQGDQGRERLALRELGEVLRTIGQYDEALQVLEQAARAYEGAGDLEAEAAVVSQIGFLHAHRGAAAEGIPRVEPVLGRMAGRVSPSAMAALHLPLIWLYQQVGRFRDCLTAAERAVELAEASYDRALAAKGWMLLGDALYFVSMEAARQALKTAVSVAEDARLPDTLCWVLVTLAQIHGALGEPEAERRYAARALEIAERVNDPQQMAFAERYLAEAHFTRGEWQRSRVHVTRYAALVRTLGSSVAASHPVLLLDRLALSEGDWERAATSLEEVITAEHLGHPEALWEALVIRAELDLLQGQPAEALAHLQPLLTDVECAEAQWTRHFAVLAEAYLEVGDGERSRAVLDEGLALAGAMQNRRDVLVLRRVERMLLARDGQWEEAEEVFQDAVSLARSSSAPYEEARVLYEWGGMNREAGAVQRAREHLEEALTLFRRLGAKPCSERTERLLSELERRRT